MNPSRPRLLRRLFVVALFSGLVIVTLTALVLSVVRFQGRRDWAQTKAELLAKGEKLSLAELQPPPVPDERNFFADPIWQPAGADNKTAFERINTPLTAEERAALMRLSPPLPMAPDAPRAAIANQLALHGGDLLRSGNRPAVADALARILAPFAGLPEKIHLLLERPDAYAPECSEASLDRLALYPGYIDVTKALASLAFLHLIRGETGDAAKITVDLFRLGDRLALGRQPEAIAQQMVEVRQTLIACALERYRLAHGEYPKSLADLVPAFLEKIPTDVRSLQPLRYQRTGPASFRLWAAGPAPEADIVWQN